MNINKIRYNFHHLIDEIENEKILEQFYEVLKSLRKEKHKIDFWDLFTDEQKKELEQAWEESEKEENLISHNAVMEDAAKWLKK